MSTILVIDDNDDSCESVVLFLQCQSYDCVGVKGGQEALDYLHEGKPCNLILLDMFMPSMSGPEFMEIYSADSSLIAVPVIVMSGANERIPLSAYGYIMKATDPEKLLRMIYDGLHQ